MQSILVKRRPDAADVCIAFSSRSTPAGGFTFFKVLADFPANIIFVNDYSNSWYLRGTPDFADEAHMRAFLRAQIEELRRPGGKVFTMGSSMGAYAALKYGSALDADRVFALGPESELSIPLGKSIESLTGHEEGHSSIVGLPYRVPQDVLVLSGNNDIVDFYCACKLKADNPNINVKLINNYSHVVPRYLQARFDLAAITEAFLLTGRTDFLAACDVAPTAPVKLATALKMFNQRLAARETAVEYGESIRELAGRIPQWSMPQYFCALIADELGNNADCESHLRAAVAAQPGLGRAALRLAKLLYDTNRITECIDRLESTPAHSYSAKVAELLSRAHEKRGDLPNAIAALERFLPSSLDPKTKEHIGERLRVLNRRRFAADSATIKAHSTDHALVVALGTRDLHRYRRSNKSNYAPFYYIARSLYQLHFRTARDPRNVALTGEPSVTLALICAVLKHCNQVTGYQNQYCIAYECAARVALGEQDAIALRERLLNQWPQMQPYLQRVLPFSKAVAA